MTEPYILLDPTAELTSVQRPRLTPPESLSGKVIALLDIGKTRSDEFLDRVAEQLISLQLSVRRYAKPTNVRVAPADVIHRIASECDVVVAALAD